VPPPPRWVHPPKTPLDATVRPPGSKSLTNRALLLAALADGPCVLSGILDADDTRRCVAALRALGVEVTVQDDTATVHGTGGRFAPPPAPLDVGTAGTVARFLTAILAMGPHPVALDGSARMRERPMAGLLAALSSLGGTVVCEGAPGALPLRAGGPAEGPRGGSVVLTDPPSSQFVSALLYAGLAADRPVQVAVRGALPARPYVAMTVAVARAFGARIDTPEPNRWVAHPGPLAARAYAVEPDASSASYLLAAAAIFGGRVTVEGLGRSSLQGDARFVEVLAAMGARVEQDEHTTTVTGTGQLTGVDVSLADMPDLALTVAVAALHAKGRTVLRDVGVLRHHESDRLAAAARELRKFGATVTEHDAGLVIDPPPTLPEATVPVATYDDHRMAMAFSLGGDVLVHDPRCVEKTYPGFFNDLARLGMVEPA